jgi:hypothetical protein
VWVGTQRGVPCQGWGWRGGFWAAHSFRRLVLGGKGRWASRCGGGRVAVGLAVPKGVAMTAAPVGAEEGTEEITRMEKVVRVLRGERAGRVGT